MVTLFFKKNKFLEHYHHISNFVIFLETLFRFSILDIFKMSIFKNPIRLLKILFQLIDIIFELKENIRT